jgi:signal transduction histidine kinase
MMSASTRLREHRQQLEARVAEAISDLQHEEEERRKTEVALAHAQRLESIGQLTGGIAHDFNNMLMVISANLELIGRQATTDRVKQLVARAQSGTFKGARLVSALLAFARKQPLRSEIVNVNDLIQEFEPVLRGAIGDTVVLSLKLKSIRGHCQIDGAQFQSALLNLLTNSRAAMPEGGNISIETSVYEADGKIGDGPVLDPGLYLQITVSDTGQGMMAEAVARAFEPFYTTKDVGKGTGLGLSQVYGFAKQSGGNVALNSEAESGTTVHLYLPLYSDMDQSNHPPSEGVPFDNGGQETVMIVDDDAEVRATLIDGLGSLGYRMVEAIDGQDALQHITSGQPIDVIVTDDLMPNKMTGRELARHIATVNPRIVTIVLSGNPPAEEMQDDPPVFQKPILLADLAQAIRDALKHDRAQEDDVRYTLPD